MKFSCTQENLNQGLFVVGHIAGKNNNLPILNNILIQTQKGGLKFQSTNLEIGIACLTRAKVEEEGEFTVPAKILTDYVSFLPKEKVDAKIDGQNIELTCGGYHTKIRGFSATDFPLIPEASGDVVAEISLEKFTKAISQVVFAASANDSRPEICGLLLKFSKNNELILTSTDSYRLAEKKIKLKKGSDKDLKVIVPAKTMRELLRIFGGGKDIEDGELKIRLGENQIFFSYDNIELTSRLVEGQYPDYEQIIPKDHQTKAKININEFIKGIKTASLFSRSGIYDVHLNFNPQKNKLIISSLNNQLGENTSKIETDVHGEESDIVLNHRYLLDGLNSINGEDVYLEMSGPDSPCLLKPATGDNYLYIIMPIKQ